MHVSAHAPLRSLLLAVVAIAATVLLADSSQAIDVALGVCPVKQTVQDLQVESYMGHWYEWKRYWQFFELNGKCVEAEYTLNKTSGVVTVRNSQIDEKTGEPKSIEGTAVLVNPPEGKLSVTFPIPVVGDRTAPYWVLETDYLNYSVVYSCTAILGLVRVESAWVLTRTPSPTSKTIADIEKAISKAQLRESSFQKTKQDCSS